MNYELDSELAPAMAALAAKAAEAPRPARGDWRAVREAASAGLAYMATLVPATSGVTTTSFTTATRDGEGEIELRWYTSARRWPKTRSTGSRGSSVMPPTWVSTLPASP